MECSNALGVPVWANAGAMVSKEIGFARNARSHVLDKKPQPEKREEQENPAHKPGSTRAKPGPKFLRYVHDWNWVVVSQDLHGRMSFADPQWRSRTAKVIAASQLRKTQAAMLLVKPGDLVRAACGIWRAIALRGLQDWSRTRTSKGPGFRLRTSR
jgi:hypothetical protein